MNQSFDYKPTCTCISSQSKSQKLKFYRNVGIVFVIYCTCIRLIITIRMTYYHSGKHVRLYRLKSGNGVVDHNAACMYKEH